MKKELLLAGVSAIALALAAQAGPAWADDPGAQALINHGQEPVVDDGNGPPSPPPQGETTVIDNEAVDNGSFRTNEEINGHNDAAGITHVQQNNGSNNSINAATAVQATMNGGSVTTGASVNSNTLDNDTEHHGGTRTNDVLDSYQNYSGVATVQQNNGDHNEIGAATAVHSNNGGGGDVAQFATTNGTTSNNTGDGTGGALWDDGSTRINLIDPSFDNAQGVITVQQNNGNANAIGAATTVAANIGSGSVAQLALTTGAIQNQMTQDSSIDRDNIILDSFNGAAGVLTVQQNNGDANVMGVATAVAANIGTGLGDPLNNDVEQLGGTLGSVEDAWAEDNDQNFPDGQRENIIDPSFTGASGIASVQQNNGSNNVMGIANVVQANIDTGPVNDLDGDDNVFQLSFTVGGTVANSAVQNGSPLTPPGPGVDNHRQNLIEDSFDDFSGLASVQQNNGDNNVMGVGNAVVANINSGDKTDDVVSIAATLGSSTENSSSDALGANRDNLLTGSFENASGVITVQQNNGNNNVMGAANAVVANLNNESDPVAGSVANLSLGLGSVMDNFAEDGANTDRVNTIDNGSFNGSSGLTTAQQNNGDNNVIGSSTSVVADDNSPDRIGFGPAASLAALGSVVSGNTTIVNATSVDPGYKNTISGSYVGASGVMVTQQNNGSNNVMGSSISVVANY